MRSVRRLGQPSPLVMRMARRQISDRMPAKVRIVRKSGQLIEIPDSLDVELGEELVYQGRASLRLQTAGPAPGQDEVEFLVNGSGAVPYAVEVADGSFQRVMPMVEDTLIVDEHVDPVFIGAVLRVKGVSRGGHLPLQRELTLDGVAPSSVWADMSVTEVVEAEEAP